MAEEKVQQIQKQKKVNRREGSLGYAEQLSTDLSWLTEKSIKLSDVSSSFISVKGTVISIEETSQDGPTISNTDIIDTEGNIYSYISYKSSDDILEGDVVEFLGTPLGVYSFDNVSGGLTNSIAIFGGQIEKR